MKKRFIQFMLMLMVAIVPYTATPFIAPASADVCEIAYGDPCPSAVDDAVTTAQVIVTTVGQPPQCNGGGVCCARSSDPNHPDACTPPPPPCPYSPCP